MQAWFSRLAHKLYEQAAIERLTQQRNEKFDNFDVEHAAILATVMIGMCKENEFVRVFSGRLAKCVYFDALQMTSSNDIKILLDEPDDNLKAELAWLASLDAHQSGRVQVRTLRKEQVDALRQKTALPGFPGGHFFFCSSGSYRLEIDHGSARAEANFADPQRIEQLRPAFDKLFEGGEVFHL